jgi:NAD(P)-dependent dehydrogenase (short-subunit alcohol dehydrogenase family)
LRHGHRVVVHAWNQAEVSSVAALTAQGVSAVVGDLASQQQTQTHAFQVKQPGRTDAVVHNAGVYADEQPLLTAGPFTGVRRQRPRPVSADYTYRPAEPAGLFDQRHADRW